MSNEKENIYRRADGRYEGRYPLGRRQDGRIHYGYVYGEEYDQVSRELTKRKLFVQREPVTGPDFGKFAADWLRGRDKSHMKRSTLQTYSGLLNRYLLPWLEDIPVHRISSEMVQLMVNELEEQGYAPATVRATMRLLLAILRDARRAGLRSSDIEDVTWRGGRARMEQRVLSKAEQQRILREATDDADMPVLVALFTGLRLGEICALKWRDIDWDRAALTVRRTAQRLSCADSVPAVSFTPARGGRSDARRGESTARTEAPLGFGTPIADASTDEQPGRTSLPAGATFEPEALTMRVELPNAMETPKPARALGGRKAPSSRVPPDPDAQPGRTALSVDTPKSAQSNRTIPIPQPLLERLRLLRENSGDGGEYIFACDRPMEPRTAQRRFHALMQRAGVSEVHFHTLRHSFATQMLELGVDVKTVSVLLGHSSVRTTLEFYAHSRMEHQRKAMDDLADALTDAPRPTKRGKKHS